MKIVLTYVTIFLNAVACGRQEFTVNKSADKDVVEIISFLNGATVTVLHNQKRIRSQVAIRVQEALVADIILRAKFILAPECTTKIIQGSNELLPINACIDRNIETDILRGNGMTYYFSRFG